MNKPLRVALRRLQETVEDRVDALGLALQGDALQPEEDQGSAGEEEARSAIVLELPLAKVAA